MVIVRSHHVHVEALDWARLDEVEPFALWDAFDHVHHYHVGQLPSGDAQGAIGADIAGAHNRYFSSHRAFKVGQVTMPVKLCGIGIK